MCLWFFPVPVRVHSGHKAMPKGSSLNEIFDVIVAVYKGYGEMFYK